MIYTYGIAALKFCFRTCVAMNFVDDDDDDDMAHAKMNTGVTQHRQWAAETTKPHTHGGPSPHTWWAQPSLYAGNTYVVTSRQCQTWTHSTQHDACPRGLSALVLYLATLSCEQATHLLHSVGDKHISQPAWPPQPVFEHDGQRDCRG